MKFDKGRAAYMLSFDNIGRKDLIERVTNNRFFDIESKKEEYKYLKELIAQGVKIISYRDNLYPPLLKNIYDYPLLLFAKGNIFILKKPMITIVGTRDMSEYGKWCVRYILEGIKDLDIVVVSGLARGIDGTVHQECLNLGIDTVAIVAGGIDIGYPKSNQLLYEEIFENGLIISEFPIGRRIVKGMFPLRNRILAGISICTVVIESSESGGSLITAQVAIDSNRDVFCIPCNINKFSSQGCNMLIEQGAHVLYKGEKLIQFLENQISYMYEGGLNKRPYNRDSMG